MHLKGYLLCIIHPCSTVRSVRELNSTKNNLRDGFLDTPKDGMFCKSIVAGLPGKLKIPFKGSKVWLQAPRWDSNHPDHWEPRILIAFIISFPYFQALDGLSGLFTYIQTGRWLSTEVQRKVQWRKDNLFYQWCWLILPHPIDKNACKMDCGPKNKT